MNEYYVFEGDTTLNSELPFSMPLKVVYENYMDHCQKCSLTQNDRYLYNKPDIAFYPTYSGKKIFILQAQKDLMAKAWL